MNSREDGKTRRILILIKFDIDNLYERLTERRADYISIFSMKRTREHFNVIFKSRYDSISISDLSLASEEIIVPLNTFYKKVDELHWYFLSTEDLPATVEDKVKMVLKNLKSNYEIIKLYLEAELNHLSGEDDLL